MAETSVSIDETVVAVGLDCTLTPESNTRLLGVFEGFVDCYAAVLLDELLAHLATPGRLEPGGLDELRTACAKDPPIFDATDMRRVAAYADFAREELEQHGPLPIEVRDEGWKVYLLVPPEFTVLRSAEGRSLLWVHDETWATDREGGKDLGLCGQFLGRSKFVTPCTSVPASKGAALDALGLRGYAAFDKPGTLFVVHAQVSPAFLARADPLVPLLYKVGVADDKAATVPERWKTQLHFQEGALPGFTSGLRAELVMNTFQLPAVTALSDVTAAGVTCVALAHE